MASSSIEDREAMLARPVVLLSAASEAAAAALEAASLALPRIGMKRLLPQSTAATETKP